MRNKKYKTKYEETLATIFQFSFIFKDIYDNPPNRRDTIDNTIQDFLTKINEAVGKDEGS